jgi:hypothetical protein
MKRRDALKRTALLGGSAALSTSLLTLLQSCQSQPRSDWQPRFLSSDHARLITALVDTLLPTTDTPGGVDVKVDMFIDLVFYKMYDEATQQARRTELDRFNETCIARFGKAFYQLDADQMHAILREEEANAPTFNGSVWGTAVGEQAPVGFFRSFKSLAIWGYCTSEEIGKNVLNYDPLPGPYQGCIPFSDVGKVWSL